MILEGADSMRLGPLLWRYVASTDIQRRVLELRSHPGRSQAVVIDSALSKRSGGQGRAPALQSSYAKPAAVLARGAVIAVIARPHQPVTSVVQSSGHAWQTVSMSSHLPVALVGARMVEQLARGAG
jgi:hypothetical protein